MVRVISTKLAIEGEAEYKQKIASVNSELKTLDSELKLVESAFKGQANSMEALTTKGTALQNIYDKQAQKVTELKAALENAQSAQTAYTERIEAAKTKISAAEDELVKLKNSTGATTEEQKKLTSELDKLGKELKDAEAGEAAAGKGINDWKRQVNNAQIKLSDLDRELKQNDTYLTEAKNATDKCATSIDKYGKEVKQAADETDNANEKTGLLSKIFAGGLLANVATQALNAVWSALKKLATGAMDTADELMKTSDVTGRSVEELQQLTYVAEDVGISLDTISNAQRKFTMSMDDARKGSAEYTNAFKTLKVDAVDPTTGALRDSTIVMYEAFDALGKIENGTERDALALQLFGRSAMELNPLIKAGSNELNRLSEEAKNTGAVMSENTVKVLDAAGDAFDHLKQSIVAFVGEGMAALVEKFGAETVDSLTKSTQALNEVSTAADNTVASNAAAGEVAQDYLDRLEELETQGLNTAEAQKEYSDTVAKLNALIPDLNLTIDEQTGFIEGSTKALEDNIVAWKEAAMAQALQDRYKDIIAAQANAMAELAENQGKYNQAAQTAADYGAQLDVVYLQIAEALGLSGEQAKAMADEMRKSENVDLADWSARAGVELSSLSGNVFDLVGNAAGLRGELIKSEQSQKTFATAIEVSSAAVKRNADGVLLAEQTMKGLLGITEETTGAVNIDIAAIENAAVANKANSEAALTLAGTIDKCNAALAEQAENGKLSADTILSLTDAGYAAALQTDKETGAVRLNKDAYNELTSAKLKALRAVATAAQQKAQTDAMVSESMAAAIDALGLYDLAKARYAEAAAAKKQSIQEDANIKALDTLIANVGNYSGQVTGAGRATETAADKASKAFDKSVKEIDRALALGEISQEEYWARYTALMNEHLKKGTDTWDDANFKLLKGQKDLNNELEKESKKIFDTMSGRLEDIKDEYDKAISDIQGDIDDMASSLAGFGDTATFAESDSGDVTAALEDWNAQTQAITDFGSALDALKTKGIPESLMSQIASMDPDKGTALANTLLGLSDTQWADQMAAWDAKQQAAQALAETYYADDVKVLNDTLTTAVTDLQTDMTKAGLKLGGDIVDGLVKGITDGTISVQNAIESLMIAAQAEAQKTNDGYINQTNAMIPALKATYTAAALAANQAYRDALEEKSPSKKAMRASEDYIKGNILGVVNMQDDLEKVYAETALLADRAMRTAMPSDGRVASAGTQSASDVAQIGEILMNSLAPLMMGGQSIIINPAPVNINGKTVAQIIFEPLDDVAKQKGVKRGE